MMKSILKTILFVSLLVQSSQVLCASSTVYVRTLADLTSADAANTRFVFKTDLDLNGARVSVPGNSVCVFKRGSIKNGTLVLNNTELVCENTGRIDCLLEGTCCNTGLTVRNEKYGYSHIAVLQSGAEAHLESDIAVPKTLVTKCSILGRGNERIYASSSSVNVLLNIASSGVVISNIRLSIDNDTPRSQCYSIRSFNAGDLVLDGIFVENGSVYITNTKDIDKSGYRISNSHFCIDHTKCDQDYYLQSDAFELRGLENLQFVNNAVDVVNVNRVFKTPAGGLNKTPCSNLVFKGNRINASSVNGKQIFDFYHFTRNVTIADNHITAKGHTDVFENKTQEDYSTPNFFIIENNTIEYDFSILYFNLNRDGDSRLQIRNNMFRSIACDHSRKGKGDGKTVDITRDYDIDVRNIPSVEISDNVFEGVGGTESAMALILNVDDFSFNGNLIDCIWPQGLRLTGSFKNVAVSGNKEKPGTGDRNIKTFVELNGVNADRVSIISNATENHSGNNYLLMNGTKVKDIVFKGNTMKKKSTLFSCVGGSGMEKASSDGAIYDVIPIPGKVMKAKSQNTVTISTGTVEKSSFSYVVRGTEMPCNVVDGPGSTVKLVFTNNSSSDIKLDGAELVVLSCRR